MDRHAPTQPLDLPLEVEERIDRLCLRFEQAWRSGTSPGLSPFLDEVPAPWRRALLYELVRIEAEYRARHGQPPPNDLLAAHPELADELRPLLCGAAPRPAAPDSGRLAAWTVPPTRVGHFRIVRELGRGGMGVVYEAIQAPLGRRVALKVLAAWGRGDGTEGERFRREAEVASRLHHTNIVPVFEAGQDGEVRYYAMQLIAGLDLRQFLELLRRLRSGPPVAAAPDPVPWPAAELTGPAWFRHVAEIGRQVASALAYAHEQGVIHRDVKPTNLLLDARGTVWVTDFGLVKTVGSDPTSGGLLAGTLRYLAPERLRGVCDQRSDLYALGLTLYELATLQPAFPQRDDLELVRAIQQREPPAPSQLARLPRDLETIILRATRKDPERRYAGAADLAEDLRRFLAGEPIRARRIGPLERAGNWAKRNPALAACLALACSAVAVVALVLARTTRQAVRHAEELRAALEATRRSEQAALCAERHARASESEAVGAKRGSDLLAAQLRFSGALALANEGSVDQALFEMVQALRLVPAGPEHEPLRRVLRANLTAWSERTAKLRFAFRLPGRVSPGPYGSRDNHLRRGFISAAATDTFVTVGPDQDVRQWSFSTGAAVGRPFDMGPEGVAHRPYSVSPDGRWLTTCGPNPRLYDLDTGVGQVTAIQHCSGDRPSEYTYLMFTSEASVFATTSASPEDAGCYSFWDARTQQPLPVRVRLNTGDSYRVAPDETGRPLLLISRAGQGTPPVPGLEILDLRSGAKRSPPVRLAGGLAAPPTAPHPGSVVCLLRPEAVRAPQPLRWDAPVCHWDLDTGRLAATPWQPPVSAWYRFLAADDSLLVTHCRDGRIRLFDLDAGRQLGGHVSVPTLHTPDTHQLSIGLAVAPDGASLATVSLDGVVRCWDVRHLVAQSSRARNQSPSHYPCPARPGEAEAVVALSADGRRAFFARGDVGRVVELDTGEGVGDRIEQANLRGAEFSPDGAYLATATLARPCPEPPVVRLWDAATGKALCRFDLPNAIHGLRFSPDGRLLAVAGVGGTSVIDVGRKSVRHTLPEGTCAVNLAFSPDGRQLAIGYRGGWGGKAGAGFRLWDPHTGEPLGPFRRAWSWWSPAQPLGFAAGGDVLMVLDPDGRKLTRLEPGRPDQPTRELPVQSPTRLAVTPASPALAVIGTSGAIELWDARTGQYRRTVPSGCEIRNLHLSPDGTILAAVCSDQAVRLWDLETGFPLGPPLDLPSPVAALTFRAGGGEVVVATECGRLFRRPLPEPMAASLEDIERRLEARLGLTFRGGEATLLTPEAWNQTRDR